MGDGSCLIIVLLVVLAAFWWLSTIIGEAWSIEPWWVFWALVVVVVALLCVLNYLLTRADKKMQSRFEEIKNNYPKAYTKYATEKGHKDESKIPQSFKKEVTKRSDYSWKNEEQTLVKEEQDKIKKKEEEERAEENRQLKEIESHYPNGLRIWKERYPMLSSNQRYMVRSRDAISILEDEFVAKEEQRKLEEKRIAKQKREEQRIRLQSTAKDVLVRKAKSWNKLFLNFYYTWLFYYYPTTCDFEAGPQECNDRYTIWKFKNDPEKRISPKDHEDTLDDVIPKIIQRLNETFGEEYVQFLTLVCLPASTKAKNAARYDEFSNRLCEETGMENGYGHTHVVRDGLSKNHPENHTGRSIQPVIEFDNDFFRGKNVLLFDDVVTKGGTMLRYKDVLRDKGATVIGGICLGKTKHEPPENLRYVPVDIPYDDLF